MSTKRDFNQTPPLTRAEVDRLNAAQTQYQADGTPKCLHCSNEAVEDGLCYPHWLSSHQPKMNWEVL